MEKTIETGYRDANTGTNSVNTGTNDANTGTNSVNTGTNDANTGTITFIGLISAILLIELVVGIQVLFYNTQEEEIVRKDVSQPSWELNALLLKQQGALHSYSWVDRERQTVAIPIDVAMKRLVEQQSTRPAGSPR